MPQQVVAVFAAVAGVLMATFQLARPWGDVTEDPAAMAEAFADGRWVVAHAAGAASFVVLAFLAYAVVESGLRDHSIGRRPPVGRIARLGAALGAALLLPYYGAETFALHEIGRAALTESWLDVVELSGSIRMNAVAVSLFGVGLLLVTAGMICVSIVAARAGVARWAAWPLGVMAALALPQFALAPVGRMIYGVVFLLAAILFAVAWRRRTRRIQPSG